MNLLDIISQLKTNKVIPKLVGTELKLVGQTQNLSADLIQKVKDNKLDLIDYLNDLSQQLTLNAIQSIPQAAHYPVSNAQNRLWVLSHLDGASFVYNIVKSFHLKGKLDIDKLQKALQLCVQRHESLRTIFKQLDGALKQIILNDIPTNIDFENISQAEDDVFNYLEGEENKIAQHQFNLATGPLFHVKLVQISDEDFVIILAIHHIISDGWSVKVLMMEWLHLYYALCNDEQSSLPALDIQYKDYSNWLTENSNNEKARQSSQYWKEQLSEPIPAIDLLTDFMRPDIKNFEGRICKYYKEKGEYKRILDFCKNQKITPFNFFRATLSLFLSKYANQKDIIVGTPVSNRTQHQLEQQIGLYVNTIPLRVKIDPTQSCSDFLQEVSQNSTEAFLHQDYSFDKIIEDVNLIRDISRNPLFDVMIVVQDSSLGNRSLNISNSDLKVDYLDSYIYKDKQVVEKNRDAKFDLSFNFDFELDGQFYIEIEYATSLFAKTSINRMHDAYWHVVDQVMSTPDQLLQSITIVNEQARHQIFNEFNHPIDIIEEQSIIDLLAPSFAKNKKKEAIIHDNTTVSYEELANWSQNIANKISKEKAPNIGLMVKRSPWMIATIIGILKSGKGYIPIDTKYPETRINYIIKDGLLETIIVDDYGATLIPESFEGNLIHIDSLKELDEQVEYIPLSEKDLREQTAYLIYTSGSTGTPKGVDICHRNTIAFLKWCMLEYGKTRFDILYANTSYCFDISIYEFFFPLMHGKTIRLLDSGLEIPRYLGSDKNVLVNTVPSVVRILISNGTDWTNANAINLAGERVPKIFKEQLDYHRMEIRNLYGPSEDTTYSTMYRFVDDDYLSIPVGRPVSDTHLYILDEFLNPVPIGVSGEIYISGQSVAKGYFNKPEMTAKRFTKNPFIPHLPMYRTGDIGRWLPDGQVDFIGRMDDQVKVRGFRIELGEIQYVLEQHESVKHAAIVINTVNDEAQITAYWEGSDSFTNEELKAYTASKMPEYMLPEHWVYMDKIPLNANGKVDRPRLPKIESDQTELADIVPPNNAIQESLIEIWKEALQLDKLGIHNNFFDVGGHSLKAVKLKFLIESKLQKSLSINEVFSYPTVEKQEKLLQSKPKLITSSIPKIEAKDAYQISFAQQRLWVLTKFAEASKAYHMSAAFLINGVLQTELLEQAFTQLIRRHEILRTVFAEREEHPVQIILPINDVSFSIEEINIEQSTEQDELHQLIQSKWEQAFDLEKGPLLRCFIVKTPKQQILSFNMHHMISDGWSVEVLYQELLSNYKILSSGKQLPHTDLAIQYKDFAAWQRNEFIEGKMTADKDYWLSVFEDNIPTLDLPTDFHRPNVKSYNGNTHKLQLSQELSQEINKLSLQNEISLFSTLMTAVNILLKKYTDQHDIVIGTPTAGRVHQQLQDQIGFYVNTIAIRTKIDSANSFNTIAKAEHDNIQTALDHQSFPFEVLVDELDLERDLSRSPLFDVMLVLQNEDGFLSEGAKELTDNLSFERIPLSNQVAKCDLTFSFFENTTGLQLELEYNTDLFKEETIKRMANHLQLLFERIAEKPDDAIRKISILSKEEFKFFGVNMIKNAVPFDKDANIISLFNEAVTKYPNNTALEFGDTTISYQELDQKSTQLANILVDDYDVNPEELVLLHFDRGPWMLISILGVLKAGAAYVPVDPTYPIDRINYIINDSNADIVLYDTPPTNELTAKHTLLHFVDVQHLSYKTESASLVDIKPNNLAYVIYTSGTTGNPKGVLVEHRNVTRLLFNDQDLFDFKATDKWSLFHSYCFDFSVWEMYGALLKGGTLVIVPKEVAQDSLAFYHFLWEKEITVLNQTPTAFRGLSNFNQDHFQSKPLKLRYLIFGGEALMPNILQEWANAFPTCKNINMYGITETTVHVTYKEITKTEIEQNKSIIGQPIPTLGCYILDKDKQHVPIGVVGELYVAGAGVARGYLNKAELTAEKFLPAGPKQKIYRSGDYARVLTSGELEYIGRKDNQVKIRGHRIELAEIESAIRKQNFVKDGVVLTWKNDQDQLDLVAYVIFKKEAAIDQLRNELWKSLPAYMVPSYLIELEDIPLNRNGKLDTNALPKPTIALEQNNYVPARNELDEKIIAIWKDVLKLESIGIKDNFFNLGGHSLKATRVVSKLYENFDIKVDMKNFFEEPTIEQLSDYIATLQLIGDVKMIEGEEEIIL